MTVFIKIKISTDPRDRAAIPSTSEVTFSDPRGHPVTFTDDKSGRNREVEEGPHTLPFGQKSSVGAREEDPSAESSRVPG